MEEIANKFGFKMYKKEIKENVIFVIFNRTLNYKVFNNSSILDILTLNVCGDVHNKDFNYKERIPQNIQNLLLNGLSSVLMSSFKKSA